MKPLQQLTQAEMLQIKGGSPVPESTVEYVRFWDNANNQLEEILAEIDFYYENFNWFE